jgi:hypothetical protein
MMSSDNDAAFVAIALSLCLINEKNCRRIKELYKWRLQYTRKFRDRLNAEWA